MQYNLIVLNYKYYMLLYDAYHVDVIKLISCKGLISLFFLSIMFKPLIFQKEKV